MTVLEGGNSRRTERLLPARQLATPILVVRMVRASFVLLGLVARLTAADEQFGFVLADKADISLDFAKELER